MKTIMLSQCIFSGKLLGNKLHERNPIYNHNVIFKYSLNIGDNIIFCIELDDMIEKSIYIYPLYYITKARVFLYCITKIISQFSRHTPFYIEL